MNMDEQRELESDLYYSRHARRDHVTGLDLLIAVAAVVIVSWLLLA